MKEHNGYRLLRRKFLFDVRQILAYYIGKDIMSFDERQMKRRKAYLIHGN